MTSVTPARRKAAAVLRAVSRGRRLDVALPRAFGGLSDQDRRWVQEVTYGTLRLRGRLDHLLDLHLKKGIESVPGLALDLLRMGAYQLLFMGGVPAYAAISQTVDQVRGVMGPGGGRLANGVLRSLEREGGGESRFPEFQADPLSHLTSWGSHPLWLVKRWLDRWGPEKTRVLVEENNRPAPLYLHPLGMTIQDALERLRERGWDCTPLGDGIPSLRLGDGTNPANVLDGIDGIIQDPAAGLVTMYADPPPGVRILDLCAAPGGKGLALAADGHPLLAGDRSLTRLGLLRENAARLRLPVDLMVADARRPPVADGEFVLLDVPCSGTGTLRRHPDARWRLRKETLVSLVSLQKEILSGVRGLIPKGGHLVYSTCTLEEEENWRQVEGFLRENPGFRVEKTGKVPEAFITGEGCLQVLPQDSGFDGSFAARLVRKR